MTDVPVPTWTGDLDRVCGEGAELHVITDELRDEIRRMVELVDEVEFSDYAPLNANSQLRQRARQVEKRTFSSPAMSGICPFEGTVEAEVVYATLRWTCPVCTTPHEDAPED